MPGSQNADVFPFYAPSIFKDKVKGEGRSFDANFKGCAESGQLIIQKGFTLLLLAQK